MSGNLSHQIEHHLFPDLPSNRYTEIAPQIRALCQRYELPYNAGPLIHQTASVWKRIFRLALPGPNQRPENSPSARAVIATVAA
jgi:fatty acid desaturase